jgi:predicted GIY-YIG superfamily endonuclease
MPYFCYLLRSLSSSTTSYIGFTNNPRRRIRQHNGEIKNGARKTIKQRPWIHVAIISGFPNKIVALQFEWQWQHPKESRIIRDQIDGIILHRGWQSNIKLLHILLQTPLWSQLHLRAHFIMKEAFILFNSYSNVSTYTSRLDELDYFDNLVKVIPLFEQLEGEQVECFYCSGRSGRACKCNNEYCSAVFHILCIGKNSPENGALIPSRVKCPACKIENNLIEVITRAFDMKEGRVSVIDLIGLDDDEEDDEDNNEEEDDFSETSFVSEHMTSQDGGR